MFHKPISCLGMEKNKTQHNRSTHSLIKRNVQQHKINTNKSSAVAEIGDRGHNRHGPKRGGLLCPFCGQLGPRLTQCGLGRGLLPYQVVSSSIQPFGHKTRAKNCMGVGLSFIIGEAGSPSNTKSPGRRPNSIPSCILVHPAVWPKRTLAENSRGRGAGSPSNTMSCRRGLPPYQVAS